MKKKTCQQAVFVFENQLIRVNDEGNALWFLQLIFYTKKKKKIKIILIKYFKTYKQRIFKIY